MILTIIQPTVSEPIAKKMTKDFNQLMPLKTLDAPFVPLQHVANVNATFKMIQKTAKFATKNLTLLSNNVKLRRALLTSD